MASNDVTKCSRPTLAAVFLTFFGPLAAQSFDYVHGGVGFRCESLGANQAWFSFDGGVIRYTTDGGASILNASVPDSVRNTLRGIHMDRDQSGWFGYCVGDDGVVLFTTDKGVTWSLLPTVMTDASSQNPNVPAQLWDVWFDDRSHGYVIGFDNTMQETWDGGQTWADISPSGHVAADNPEWYQMHAFSNGEFTAVADNGWIARWLLPANQMAVSQIDQSLWCYLPQLASQPWDLELWAVDFVGDVGIAAGGVGHNDGYIFRSTDRGATWSLDSPCFDYLNATPGSTPPTFYGAELFDDADQGAVAGYGSFLMLGGPSNSATPATGCPGCALGSKAWTQVVCDSDQNAVSDPFDDVGKPLLRDVCSSANLTDGYAVGDFGTVRRTTDKGATWTELAGLHRGRIQAGDFSDTSIGVIAGQLWRIYSTLDGGQNFSLDYSGNPPINPLTNKAYSGNFNGVAIEPAGSRAVVVGDNGRLLVRDATGTWIDRSIGTWANGPKLNAAIIDSTGTRMLVGGATSPAAGTTLHISLDGGATPFVPLQLTHLGANVNAQIVDIEFDGTYVYYLTRNNKVYVCDSTTSITNAIALVPIVGSSGNATALGVRSLTDFHAGNDKGEVFVVDTATATMVKVNAITTGDLGDYVWDIEPTPGSTDWWFGGSLGHIARFDGASWTTPKSAMAQNVVGVEFFAPGSGLLIGRKTNISTF